MKINKTSIHIQYLLLIIFYILTLSLFSAAQTAASGKDTVKNQKVDIPGRNKAEEKKASTKEKETVKKESAVKTDTGDKSSAKENNKESKSADVWDDAKKGEKIESTLEYGMQKDRKIAITMIDSIKDETIKNKLIQKLVFILENDSDTEVRKAAVTAIGDHKSESSTPALIKALDDTSEDIRIAACYALGRIKADSARQKLVDLFKKQDLKLDSNFTDAIITALSDIKAPDLLETAVTAGKDTATSKMIRERLIIYIGNTGSVTQKDFLVELYKNDDEDLLMRSYAIKSIAKLKLKETTPEIKNIIKEIDSYPFAKKKKYYELYMHSVAALVEMGDTDSIGLLMNSLRSDNTSVRLKALNLIKEFNDERTIDILKYKMKNDPSGKVRKAARKALENKGLIEKGGKDVDPRDENEKEEKDE